MTHIIRRTAPAFRPINRPAPDLSTVTPLLPTTRELGADYHWLLGTDNASDLCMITGQRLHPNLRGYMVDGGTNYTVAPTVTLPDGAEATALVTSSSVWTFPLTSGGTGYPLPTQITATVSGGTYAAGGRPPRFKVVGVSGGVITAVSMLDAGSGILTVPTVSFSAASGSGAAMTLTITSGVRRIDVTAGGSGFTSNPLVAITGGTSGTSLAARAFAVFSGGAVTAVYLTECGFGYVSAPTVAITGGGGTGATATAVIGPNIVRSVAITKPGSQSSAPAVTLTGGDGSDASSGVLMSSAAYTRTVNSLQIPAGGATDNNAQNGLLMSLQDVGEHTVCVVAKVPSGATSAVIVGSATNGTTAYGGFEIKFLAGAPKVLDYSLQLVAADLAIPASAVAGDWVFFAFKVSPVAGASVTPSAVTVQSSEFYARAGLATPVSAASGERKALSRPRLIGVGNCYQYGTTYRNSNEVAEVIAFKRELSVAELDAVRTRSAARLAPRGITLVNT